MQDTIRGTVELTFKGVTKELEVTFWTVHRVGRKFDWIELLEQLGAGKRDITNVAAFIYYNLLEAGFENVDPNEVYNEMTDEKVGGDYSKKTFELLMLYRPIEKKDEKPKSTKKSKAKPRRKTKTAT